MEVSSLPYSPRQVWVRPLTRLRVKVGCQERLTSCQNGPALLSVYAVFSQWLGAAYRTCELGHWISEYSGWCALSVTVLTAGDLCGAFLRPPRGVFRIHAYLRDISDVFPDHHSTANISIQRIT